MDYKCIECECVEAKWIVNGTNMIISWLNGLHFAVALDKVTDMRFRDKRAYRG